MGLPVFKFSLFDFYISKEFWNVWFVTIITAGESRSLFFIDSYFHLQFVFIVFR